jgi:signal transduction histidine kinase
MKFITRLYVYIIFTFIFFFFFSCGNKDRYVKKGREYSNEINEFINNNLSSDSAVNQYIDIFKQEKNYYGLCLAYRKQGDNFRHTYQLAKALEAHTKSLEYAEKLHNIEMAICHNALAEDYQIMGLIDKVADEHLKALNILSNHSDTLAIVKKTKSFCYSGIGSIQMLIGYYEEAAQIFRKAMDIEVELESDMGKAVIFSNIGKLFEIQKMHDSAMHYYQHSMYHNNLAKSEVGMAITQCNIGRIKLIKGDTVAAIQDFYESIRLLRNNNNILFLLDNYQCLFDIYMAQNKIKEIKYYLSEIEKIANETGSLYQKSIFLNYNYLFHKKNNNQQLALYYLEKTREIKEEIETKKKMLNIQNFQMEFESQQNQKIIEEQNKRYEKLVTQTFLLILLAILSLTVLGLFIIISIQYKKRVKILSSVNKTKDRLFSIISHDLKNPAIAQRTLIKQLIDNFDALDKNILQQYFIELHSSANSQVELLFNLLNWAKMQIGEISARKGYFDISVALREELKFADLMLKNKNIKIVNNIPHKLIGYADKTIFSTIMRNLLSNAIKFSNIGGEILLYHNVCDKEYAIIIKDYGIGINQKQLHKIMQIDENFTMSGKVGEHGSGIGLIVCKNLAAINGGKLNISSKEGRGTTVYLTIQMDG